MKNIIQISEAEFKVMKIIWEKYPISTNDIVNILIKNTEWTPKTIQTLINRLEKKKAINHEKNGRMFIYSPLIKKDDYINAETHSFLNKFYKGAANKLVLSFIKNDMLSKEEITELKDFLDKM